MNWINWITCHQDFLSVLVLVLQLTLIWGQLRLSKKINSQTVSREKGYFIISETNYLFQEGESKRYRDLFDLKKGVPFYVSGNSDVIVRASSYSINQNNHLEGMPRDTYFTLDSRANTYVVLLDLKEYELARDQLDIIFKFQLENPEGFQYTEITEARFAREGNESDTWRLSKYNIKFI